MRFQLDGEVPRHWYLGSPFITHFFNTLSAIFPDGEQYFIDAVRAFEDRITDPRLRAHVRDFARQEGHHTHQHRLLNRLLQGMGVSLSECEDRSREWLEQSRRRDSPMMQLAITCAMEHFTALMGDWVLRHPEHQRDAHPNVAPLWIWHAVEETEHKAVAFDVYQAVGGSYAMRVWAMLRATRDFIPRVHLLQCMLMRQDPTPTSLGDVLFGLRYLYGKGGFIRDILPGYLRYYRPDFHPWHYDNSALAQQWLQANSQYQAA